MNALTFALAHYLAILGLAILSYGIGRRLIWRIHYHSWLEQLSFSITLGLGAISTLIFFLGVLGCLYRSVLLVGMLVGVVACHRVWLDWSREAPQLWKKLKHFQAGHSPLLWLVLFLGLLLLAPVILLPLYPPTDFDAILYHLPYAKTYAQHHRLVFTPYLRYAVGPQCNEMLFTLALTVYDDLLAQLIEFLMLWAVLLGIVAWGEQYFSPRVGLWSAWIFLSSPFVLLLGHVAYIDMGLTLFITMAIYAFWNWLHNAERHWLVLAGVFCGYAVGTKYSALFFLAALGMMAFYTGMKQRRLSPPLIFVLASVLIASPWLVRNFYYTGNPIYPVFHKIIGQWLGHPLWGTEFTQLIFGGGEHYWRTKSMQSAQTLFWKLIEDPGGVYRSRTLSRAFVVLLPLLLSLGMATAKIRKVLILVFSYLAFWFFSIQDARYLVPIMPLLSLVSAATIERFFEFVPIFRQWSRNRRIQWIAFAILIFPSWFYAVGSLRDNGRLRVSPEQREAYLEKRLSSYWVYQTLNHLRGRSYTVYAAFDEKMTYYTDGQFMGDWFGPASYSIIIQPNEADPIESNRSSEPPLRLLNGPALFRKLHALGASYFVISKSNYKVILPQDDFFLTHFKLLKQREDVKLYELTEGGTSGDSNGPKILPGQQSNSQ